MRNKRRGKKGNKKVLAITIGVALLVLGTMTLVLLTKNFSLLKSAIIPSSKQLKVSSDGRYLVRADGTPIFLMGEAAWAMPENATREDVDHYLNNRKNKGFNYLQIVAARDLDGESLAGNSTRTMNPKNMYGHYPFQKNSNGKADISKPIVAAGGAPTSPNDYWDHLEYIIQKAQSMDMYVGLLPVWGTYYINTSNSSMRLFTPETAKSYGYFLANRYKNYSNVIWMIGGDISSPTVIIGNSGLDIYRSMAEGLVHGTTGSSPKWNEANSAWSKLLITTHISGASYKYFNNDAWLNLNCNYANDAEMYQQTFSSYQNNPKRPSLLGESRYEGWIWNNTYHGAQEMRQQIYHSIFGGGFAGYAYGLAMSSFGANDQVFRFQPGWRNRLETEGANDMRHAVNLIKNHVSEWWTLVPDQSAIADGKGAGVSLKTAAISTNKNQLLVYYPNITTANIDLRKITSHSRAAATWYDTRTGAIKAGGVFSTNEIKSLIPPVGWTTDAVLILKGTTSALQDPQSVSIPEFKTINGEVVLAAEKYSFLGGSGGGRGSWASEKTKSGYLGQAYMRSSSETLGDGSHLTFGGDLGSLNYLIDFKETGTYYIHLRTFAEDHTENGFFATLDGEEINYGGINPENKLKASFIYTGKSASWNWYTDGGGAEVRGLKVSFSVTTPGRHTFSLYRRDTGSRVDHIWLTKNTKIPQNKSSLSLADPGEFILNDAASPVSTIPKTTETTSKSSSVTDPDKSISTVDQGVPLVQSFSASKVAAQKSKIAWSVSDSGGSHLDRIEIWRTIDSGSSPLSSAWSELINKEQLISSQNLDSHSGSVEDGTPEARIYWYKIKVFDKSGNQKESSAAKVNLSESSSSAAEDKIAPTVKSFALSKVATKKAKISWSVSDSGGANLDRVEIWRTNDSNGTPQDSSWSELANKEQLLASQNINTHSGSVEDGTPEAKIYWYKIKVFDKSGNQKESSAAKVRL